MRGQGATPGVRAAGRGIGPLLLAADRPAVLREEHGEGRPHEGDDRQFGNPAEAFRRVESGGPETYRDQRLSVDYVASLAETGTVATNTTWS